MSSDPYENFCIHPFVKMFVSTQGQMRACCYAQQPLSHDLDISKNPIENVWNGKMFQSIRKSFNKRVIPKDICRICIENEKNGIPSQRQYENKKWKQQTDYFYHNAHTKVPSPISFSLRMSNECNLQCVMCRPQLSNQIAKNMLEYNSKHNNNSYTTEWDVEKYVTSGANFNKSFVDHIVKNADRTQEIWAVGGEPFVMKGFQSMIEQLVDADKSSHITLHIISNGTVIKESWIQKYLTKFKKVVLGISLDATGSILEYIRYPSVWSILENKIIKIKQITQTHTNIQLNLEPTIQLLNLKGLESLINFVKQHSLVIDPTFLDSPKPLHFANASQKYRQQIVSTISDAVKSLIDSELMHDVSWLDWISSEPQRTLETHDKIYFKHMIEYFDATRNIKFKSLYPEFRDLIL